MPTHRLVLLRHGQSIWNARNLFTGWVDSDLSALGEAEAREGGELMARAEVLPEVVHTSVQTRAIRTADIALRALDRMWIPVRRHWRLNERHYGALQGLDKAEMARRYGPDQVHIWRRSYDVRPPALDPADERSSHHDPRYASLPPELVPTAECLRDVVDRLLPYWYDAIVPDLRAGAIVLVSAHGNSLRALVKHLQGIADDDIPTLNIPTGQPLLYDLDDQMRPTDDLPVEQRYLLDPAEIRARADAVARQAEQAKPSPAPGSRPART